MELQNSFARIDEMRDLDPDNFSELHAPKSVTNAKKKNHARSAVEKAQLAQLDSGCGVGRVVSNGYGRRLDHSGDRVGLLDHEGFHRNGRPRGNCLRPDHRAR